MGENGELLLGGIPSRKFDDIARAVPGLHESAMGGRVVSRRIFRIAGEPAEEGGNKDDAAVGPLSSTIGNPGDNNGLGEGVGGVVSGLNGVMLPVPNLYTLDDRPSLAFAPRYEAARFLADLLLLSSNREDPKVCVGGKMSGRGATTAFSRICEPRNVTHHKHVFKMCVGPRQR